MASQEQTLNLLGVLAALPSSTDIYGTRSDSLQGLEVVALEHVPTGSRGASNAGRESLKALSSVPAVLVAELEQPGTPTTGQLEALGPGQEATRRAFHPFPRLPPELRLQIWALSFTPRVVELHTRRTHYADHDRHGGGPTKWLSRSRNPAALAVSAEARAAALEFYTVAIPLAAPLAPGQMLERPGDLLSGRDRVLYVNLENDTVAVLGDPSFDRLTRLLTWFRDHDKASSAARAHRRREVGGGSYGAGRGLRRLALSVAPWAHPSGSRTLRVYARTVYADLDEFVMFMYAEGTPPDSWEGGMVLLAECGDSDHYKRFLVGRGMQFREGTGWMKVGMNELRVMDIWFEEGWC